MKTGGGGYNPPGGGVWINPCAGYHWETAKEVLKIFLELPWKQLSFTCHRARADDASE